MNTLRQKKLVKVMDIFFFMWTEYHLKWKMQISYNKEYHYILEIKLLSCIRELRNILSIKIFF